MGPAVCGSDMEVLVSRNYRDVWGQLARLTVLHHQAGQSEEALACAQTLFEVAALSKSISWKDKVEATLFFADFLQKEGRLERAKEIYRLIRHQFPASVEEDNIELVMFASAIADLFYMMESTSTYWAYSGLLELTKCNSLARSARLTYVKRQASSAIWLDNENVVSLQLDKCPSVEFFADLIE